MVKIAIEREGSDYHMIAKNDSGNSIHMDSSPDSGGKNEGMRPMQLVLAALGGCSTIDVISILRKQREDLKDIKVEVEGDRDQNVVPALYKAIHVHFKLYGSLDPEKAARAVQLSFEKYCSVAKTLEPTATLTHTFEIVPA